MGFPMPFFLQVIFTEIHLTAELAWNKKLRFMVSESFCCR